MVTAAVLALMVALALSMAPYVPLIHGSEDDEVEQLIEWLDIEAGAHVADFGAGDGSYAMALAQRVGPTGRVYATEVSAERLEEMRRASADLDNFTVVEGAVSDTNLPEQCCDAVFSRNVYHHLTDPHAINADLKRALRPGGRLLVIDFEPGGPMDFIGSPDTIDRHGGHGTPKSTVVEEVTAAGFRIARGPEPWRGRLFAVMFQSERADE